MKYKIVSTAAALLASTAIASAGGIDRTGQSIDLLFEDGTVTEFSLAFVMPSVSEDLTDEEMAPNYALFSGGFKMDYGSNMSIALLFDQPFGALADYPLTSAYPGLSADLQTSNLTALLGYDFTDNIMVYGGVAAQMTTAEATVAPVGAIDVEGSTGFGFVVGAAYQIPEYALRVSLTYRSDIDSTHDTTYNGVAVPDTTFTTPQSVNLDFQTGVNEKTLVFGSVRWVNWSAIDITASDAPVAATLVDYDLDTINYEIGVGRKFTDQLSGALSVGYESSDGELASALSPTDGRTSIGLALIYNVDGNTEITGGARYTWLGDTEAGHPLLGAVPFSDNTAVAFGISIKRTF